MVLYTKIDKQIDKKYEIVSKYKTISKQKLLLLLLKLNVYSFAFTF